MPHFALVAAALAVLSVVAVPAAAQPYGMTSAQPIGVFLNGRMPAGTPGSASGPLAWTDAFPNLRFRDPLTFTPEPGTNQLFVGSRDGIIERFDNNRLATVKQLFLDIKDRTAVVWDGGFLGHAFHPDWGDASSPNRGSFFVYYTARAPGASYPTASTSGFFNCYLRLSRFTKPDGSSVADPNSEQVLFNVRLYNGSHRGGGLLFGDDGFLYLSIGDQFRYTTAQDISDNFEGGVIRIDVDQRGGTVSHPPRRRMGVHAGNSDETSGNGYFIPSDNPFLDGGGAVFEEFWSIGHRNPHRMTIDSATGNIWEAEIGQGTKEEVNLIRRGMNYQWPYMEGTVPFRYAKPSPLIGTDQPPVIDFDRTEARAIIGGYVYRGRLHPGLVGQYICGDYSRDNVWALTLDPGGQTAIKQTLLQFGPGDLATFGQDHAGEVYACGLGADVPIYLLDRQGGGYPEAPALLSQTGAFSDVTGLVPAAGLIPYEVNTELWSDGLVKQRWLAIPNDGTPDNSAEQITFHEEDPFGFPVGTVMVKHFETPDRRRLETRLLVHGQDAWYGVTYKWNAAGTDADLLLTSLQENVVIDGQPVSYYYPSRADCQQCHNPQAGFVAGINTRQLNRAFSYPSGVTDNQLRTLNALGFFSPPIAEPEIADLPRNTPVDDSNAALEDRVRSYLDANCAQCHRAGSGRNSLDLRASRALPFQGVVDGAVSDDLGIAGARVVVPGDLGRSILYQRINSRSGCCAMPPLGRAVIDAGAVALVRAWIAGMDPSAVSGSVAQSSTAYSAPADLAVDGNIDGVFANASVTHTATELEPYWEVDLGTAFAIDRARLWNRTDCCSSRLSDFHVLLSPSPFASASLGAALAQPGVVSGHFPGSAGREEFVDLQAAGRYLRVQLAGTDPLSLAEVQLGGHTVAAGPIPSGLAVQRIAASADDAEEHLGTPDVSLGSSDLELCVDGSRTQLLGLRFTLDVPAGAAIEDARLQFTTDELKSGACDVHIYAEATDDAAVITGKAQNLSARARTSASVPWSPAYWGKIGFATPDQRTPDLSAVVQEIVDRPGWQPGNHILFLIEGTGTRTAEAFDGNPSQAPLLTVGYLIADQPPTVDAGPDQTANTMVPVPLVGTIAGATVAATVGWAHISGPGSASFIDPSDPQTAVTFDSDGVHLLRLTVSDRGYTVSDDVTVTTTSGPGAVSVQITNGAEDAEQRIGARSIYYNSSDLELGVDGTLPQLVGLRFSVDVPAGAVLQDATVQFTVDEIDTGPAQILIHAAAEDDAQSVGMAQLATRVTTAQSASWAPAPWSVVGAAGSEQQTPDLAAVLQEVIDRPGWNAGQHVMLIFSGTGERTAEAYEGNPVAAPVLRISWN